MGGFERYLTAWVLLCIVVGIAVGHWIPAWTHAVAAMEVAQVNIPVGVLIWVMVIPMLVKIDFAALRELTHECEAAFAADDPDKPQTTSELNHAFHFHIYRAAGSAA